MRVRFGIDRTEEYRLQRKVACRITCIWPQEAVFKGQGVNCLEDCSEALPQLCCGYIYVPQLSTGPHDELPMEIQLLTSYFRSLQVRRAP